MANLGINSTIGGHKIWHEGNDGPGSGLNVDTLNGLHISAFSLASHNHDSRYINETTNDTITGNLIINADFYVSNNFSVDGTITSSIINNLDITDKNIEINNVTTPTDINANDSGIIIEDNSSNKEIIWKNTKDYWLFSNNINAPSISTKSNNITHIISPQVVKSFVLSSLLTGAIKITLPQKNSNTMIFFDVDIYLYSTNKTIKLKIGGYNHNNLWRNTSAIIIKNYTSDINVRFGYDNTNNIIWIGETTSTWQYPNINISNITTSYSNYETHKWDHGWDIDIVTSFDTITKTSNASLYATNTNALNGYTDTHFTNASNINSGVLSLTRVNMGYGIDNISYGDHTHGASTPINTYLYVRFPDDTRIGYSNWSSSNDITFSANDVKFFNQDTTKYLNAINFSNSKTTVFQEDYRFGSTNAIIYINSLLSFDDYDDLFKLSVHFVTSTKRTYNVNYNLNNGTDHTDEYYGRQFIKNITIPQYCEYMTFSFISDSSSDDLWVSYISIKIEILSTNSRAEEVVFNYDFDKPPTNDNYTASFDIDPYSNSFISSYSLVYHNTTQNTTSIIHTYIKTPTTNYMIPVSYTYSGTVHINQGDTYDTYIVKNY